MQRKKVKAKNRVVKYWCASYQAEVLEQKRSFKRASAKSALNLLQASKSTTKAGVLSRQIGRAPDQARLDRVTELPDLIAPIANAHARRHTRIQLLGWDKKNGEIAASNYSDWTVPYH